MNNYKKIDENDINYFKTFINVNKIFYLDEINEDYSHDELSNVHFKPELVIKIENTMQVSKILKYSNEKLIPVVVRGSGTGLVGGALAVFGGIILDTTEMNKILAFDQAGLNITVEPGVLIMEIHKYIENLGFFYPPDPGEKSATIGGNISTNAGGMRAVKYGVTRDYVIGLEVVLANGEIVEFGGKNIKNSSGFNLKELIIGSEGTLAIVTKAFLKVLPLPKISISLLVPFNNMEEALDTVPKFSTLNLIPTAIEFMQDKVIHLSEKYLEKKFPNKSSKAYLLLTVDGNNKEIVDDECDKIAKLCIENNALDVYFVDTDERKESVWSARGAFLEAISASTTQFDECDVVVPRKNVAIFIKFTKSLEQKYNIRIPYFGHAGDGNLHIYICRDSLNEKYFEKVLLDIFDELYAKAAELKGLVSGEHGIGYAKKDYLEKQCGKQVIELMNNIKKVFDKNNILNPGKICQ